MWQKIEAWLCGRAPDSLRRAHQSAAHSEPQSAVHRANYSLQRREQTARTELRSQVSSLCAQTKQRPNPPARLLAFSPSGFWLLIASGLFCFCCPLTGRHFATLHRRQSAAHKSDWSNFGSQTGALTSQADEPKWLATSAQGDVTGSISASGA